MSDSFYLEKCVNKNATFEVEANRFAFVHQIATEGSGNVSVEVIPFGKSSFENLTVNGLQVVIALGSTFGPFQGHFFKFRFTFSNLAGNANIFLSGS